MNWSKFAAIRREYRRQLPFWFAEYEQTGDMRQDPYFFDWEFTPIERGVWSDIRTLGLPFYPQVPALNYFIDFANPFLKIGIECDGKAWHDSEKDRKRDAELHSEGWMIFRLEGHECLRIIEPWIEEEPEERSEMVEKYFMTTSEGVLSAIKRRYFDDEPSEHHAYLIDHSLFQHRSTPETYPRRRPIRQQATPILLEDSLEGYFERLILRMKGEGE